MTALLLSHIYRFTILLLENTIKKKQTKHKRNKQQANKALKYPFLDRPALEPRAIFRSIVRQEYGKTTCFTSFAFSFKFAVVLLK